MNLEFNKFNKEINEKVDIFDVIKEYLILNKKGKDFIALCPFHKDNNPSLVVSTKKQIFKCFSCGTGGTAIKFVVLFENVSFLTAYKIIAKKFNLKIDEELINKNEINKEQNKKLEILEELQNFYRMKILNPTKELNEFLIKRKINTEIIEKYNLGFAPKNGLESINFLKKKGFNEKELLKTELFNFNFKNELIDYFRDRLLFPLMNYENVLVGFSGRTIYNLKTLSKFIVSRDSDVFNKKEILFNLINIRNNFKNIQTIYLTEGFLDAIRLTELGYPTISTLGVELFSEQIGLIKESFKKVIIVPDGDFAGRKSTINNSLKLYDFKIKTLIFDHKTNLDPDKLFLSNPNILKEKENQIIEPIQFLINQYESGFSKEKQDEFIKILIKFFLYLSETEREYWLKKVELKFNISYKLFKKELEKLNIKITKQSELVNKTQTNILNNEEILLSFLLFFKEVREKFNYLNFRFQSKENEEIKDFIFDFYQNNLLLDNEKILKEIEKLKINKNKIKILLDNFFIKTTLNFDKVKKYETFNELFNKCKNLEIDNKIKKIKKIMMKSNDSSLFLKYRKLLKDKKNIVFFKI